MAVDAAGNNVAAVGVPVTGFFGFAPAGSDIPTPAEGKAVPLTLDAAWKKGGLLTEDGGFDWTLEADGDKLEFLQEGYSIPSGIATAELVVKLAQYDEIVRPLIWGKTPDVNGFITIDAGGTLNRWALFTEEIFKNRVIRRRVAADSSITKVKLDKTERGSVNGAEATFSVARSAELNNEHIGEWLIPAPAQTVAVVETALPANQGAGELLTIAGTGLTAATGVTVGGVAVPLFVVDSDTQITAVLPQGSAGSAAVRVQNAAGNSNSLAYTRDV